jgi:serine/threonine protein kinase
MHDKGIVHRDIKTENVILKDGETDEVKLVDFGLATLVTDSVAMLARCGSPGYIAPEVLKGVPYGCKVDCFSLGVLMHILLIGRGPFRGKTLDEMLVRNLRCKIKTSTLANLRESAQEVVLKLLVEDPELRPTARACLEHSWFECTASDKKVETLAPEEKTSTDQVCGQISSLVVEDGKDLQKICDHFAEDPSRDFLSNKLSNSMHFTEEDLGHTKDLAQDPGCEGLKSPSPPPAEVAEFPALRSQSPIFAQMQDTLMELRAHGVSPRTTFDSTRMTGRLTQDSLVGRITSNSVVRRSYNEHRVSERLTGRVSERFSERQSVYFMLGDDGELAPLRCNNKVNSIFSDETQTGSRTESKAPGLPLEDRSVSKQSDALETELDLLNEIPDTSSPKVLQRRMQSNGRMDWDSPKVVGNRKATDAPVAIDSKLALHIRHAPKKAVPALEGGFVRSLPPIQPQYAGDVTENGDDWSLSPGKSLGTSPKVVQPSTPQPMRRWREGDKPGRRYSSE